MKLPDAEQAQKIELQKKIHAAVVSGKGWDGVPEEVRKQADTPWFRACCSSIRRGHAARSSSRS